MTRRVTALTLVGAVIFVLFLMCAGNLDGHASSPMLTPQVCATPVSSNDGLGAGGWSSHPDTYVQFYGVVAAVPTPTPTPTPTATPTPTPPILTGATSDDIAQLQNTTVLLLLPVIALLAALLMRSLRR